MLRRVAQASRQVALGLPGAVTMALLTCGCSERTPETSSHRFPDCPGVFAPTGGTALKAVVSTESGMYAIWNPRAFAHLCDFVAWEQVFLKDELIEAEARRGALVPVYLHADGGALVEVRVASGASAATVTPEERAWTVKASQPYLFQSDGVLAISGIEQVNGTAASDVKTLPLPSGRWSVSVRMLEPPRDPSGKHDAVPNLLVLVNPEPQPPPVYRTSVETFGGDAH